ncbi:testis-expressed protein 54-like [Gracilinanus agilis]|uniref:testis-expressed protein 54-like n=1 Tax=Gracilinanus agilis TaxID=191870 RepID=UPI001CFD5C99|nr:testis-expressed protein 54-like [Gracilinanus agilis]
MGCIRSKTKSANAIDRMDAEGRRDKKEKSNESLIITVLWRRLSLFSRRSSAGKQSVIAKANTDYRPGEPAHQENPTDI